MSYSIDRTVTTRLPLQTLLDNQSHFFECAVVCYLDAVCLASGIIPAPEDYDAIIKKCKVNGWVAFDGTAENDAAIVKACCKYFGLNLIDYHTSDVIPGLSPTPADAFLTKACFRDSYDKHHKLILTSEDLHYEIVVDPWPSTLTFGVDSSKHLYFNIENKTEVI